MLAEGRRGITRRRPPAPAAGAGTGAHRRQPRCQRRCCSSLVAEGHTDEETIGLLARTHKDIAFTADDPDDPALQHLHLALHCYREAYRQTRPATGAGSTRRRWRCSSIRRTTRGPSPQTCGEQCLDTARTGTGREATHTGCSRRSAKRRWCAGIWDEAENWYAQAAAVARQPPWATSSSTRRNARLIVDASWPRRRAHRRLLSSSPRVVVFAGH